MSVYLALFKISFQQHLQYRVAAIAGAATNIAFGFFRIFLLTAFYNGSDAPQPMNLPDLYSYLWFGQVVFSVMPIVNLTGPDAEEIRSGAVAYRLIRPISIYKFYLARVLGQKVTAICTRSLIQVGVLLILLPALGLSKYGMRAPDAAMLPFLLLSLFLAVILSATIHTCIYMTGFWTISTRGSASFSYAILALLSGLLVPLVFFLPSLKGIVDLLPFRGIYDTPAMIYNGALSIGRVLSSIAHQGVWVVIMIFLGAALARRGTGRLEVAGG